MGGELDGVGFFSRASDDSGEADAPDRMSPGGVPLDAADRLSQLGGEDLFTSTLSASEFALLSDLGPEPVAQVLGACVHQVGWQYLPPEARWAGNDFSIQLNTVTQAWRETRRLAFDRLREEACSVGAHGVVSVRLTRGEHDWARHSVDFVVSGTAIRLPNADPARDEAPVLSDLSVQDYWKLTGGGWEPAGLLAATSVVFVSQGLGTRWRRRTSFTTNQELHEFSDGFSNARRAVVTDLRGQARSAKADGVVGVSLQYQMVREEFKILPGTPTPTPLSASTVLIGGAIPRGGTDERSGVVFTVHAVGTGSAAAAPHPDQHRRRW